MNSRSRGRLQIAVGLGVILLVSTWYEAALLSSSLEESFLVSQSRLVRRLEFCCQYVALFVFCCSQYVIKVIEVNKISIYSYHIRGKL